MPTPRRIQRSGQMTPFTNPHLEKIYNKEKNAYKKKLHNVIKDCNFNGAGMRQLIQEFSDEVNGS